jgi:chloramphenicol 3-O-phosphotransferase
LGDLTANVNIFTDITDAQDFANGIQGLADDGCDVIVDDVCMSTCSLSETAKSFVYHIKLSNLPPLLFHKVD